VLEGYGVGTDARNKTGKNWLTGDPCTDNFVKRSISGSVGSYPALGARSVNCYVFTTRITCNIFTENE
jgi:hypothetical protein